MGQLTPTWLDEVIFEFRKLVFSCEASSTYCNLTSSVRSSGAHSALALIWISSAQWNIGDFRILKDHAGSLTDHVGSCRMMQDDAGWCRIMQYHAVLWFRIKLYNLQNHTQLAFRFIEEYRAKQEHINTFRETQGNVWSCREYRGKQGETGE